MGFEKREEREKDIEIEKPYQFANLVAVRDPIAILKKSFFLNSLSLTLNFSSSPHSPVAGGGGRRLSPPPSGLPSSFSLYLSPSHRNPPSSPSPSPIPFISLLLYSQNERLGREMAAATVLGVC